MGSNYSDNDGLTRQDTMNFKALFYRIASKLVHQPFSRIMRGKTLGVRIVVLNDQGQVLLVRHTYSPGWILPGGGVERGETLRVAALRELIEEGGIVAKDLTLHGMFSNERIFSGDYVACYIVRNFQQQAWKPDLEIAESKFFTLDNLPNDVTGGSKRRLDEIFGRIDMGEYW
jgi:8-oxo-dGTP pyrophosphatase MutT (NUDIX family)